MAKARRGIELFDEYYNQEFGEDWPSLRHALASPGQQVARPNAFSVWEEDPWQGQGEWIPGFPDLRKGFDLPQPPKDPQGLLYYYLMDLASYLAARRLPVQEGDRILDMCAAPGGKSLILAEGLGETGELVVNDRSYERRQRLTRVLKQYLPHSVRKRIKVQGREASRWGVEESNVFDAVLLDAPCSSERHLLKNQKELSQWAPGRIRKLATQQFALLASALELVREGGTIVYSTCALCSAENDGVIAKLFKKRKGRFKIQQENFSIGQATEYGWMIRPDKEGWGPIYSAKIVKS